MQFLFLMPLLLLVHICLAFWRRERTVNLMSRHGVTSVSLFSPIYLADPILQAKNRMQNGNEAACPVLLLYTCPNILYSIWLRSQKPPKLALL